MKKSLTTFIISLIALTSFGQEWNTTNSLPFGRSSIRAVSMDGKIYFAGGYVSGQGLSNTMDVYDEALDSVYTEILPTKKLWPAYAVGDNGFYLFGGSDGTTINSASYVYKNGSWNSIANAPGWTIIAQATSLKGKIYIPKGGNNNLSDTVYIYNEQSDTWTTENLSVARYHVALTNDGERIYFAGGFESLGYQDASDVIDVYNTTTAQWESPLKLSSPRANVCAAYLNGKVFFAGGVLPGVDVSSDVVDIYNTSTQTWENSHTLIEARGAIQSAILGDRLLFIGGGGASSSKIDVYSSSLAYDVYHSSYGWTNAGVLLNHSHLSGVAATDKHIYTAGGLSMSSGSLVTYISNINRYEGYVGIDDIQAQGDLTVYPNPSHGQLSVNGITQETEFQVFDPLGRQVSSGTLSPFNNQLDLTTLQSGHYYLRVQGHTEILVIE